MLLKCYTQYASKFGKLSSGYRSVFIPISKKSESHSVVSVLETFESPLDSKEIKPVNPKGNQSWIFIGRTDAEVEAPILWPPDAKSQLIGKNSDTGKVWGQEKGALEDEMVGLHHWLNGHEFEETLGDNKGQESLVCCSPWSRRAGHDWATEQQQQNTQKQFPS